KVLFFDGKIEELRDWIEDESSPKIVHDAKTLKLDLLGRELELRGVVADTMLMNYLLEPTRQQHPLATISKKHLSCELPDLAAPVQKKKKAKTESLFDDESTLDSDETKAAARAETERLENALAHY